jgi:disulfide bond formation protein DsbB
MTSRRWFAALGALSVTALIVALISQHVFDMQPCPWCVLQRLQFAAIALVCIIALAWRNTAARKAGAALLLLLAASGAAAALWQHFVASRSDSCDLTLADRIVSNWLSLDSLLPDLFAVRASCADAAVDLFGVPYEFWSLGLFVAIGVAAAALLFRALSHYSRRSATR